ncbi:Peptidase S28 [Cynara cardunculus var. scolymus]|uniref:Peptidase S28 n=1 Tax=Cynara cardunculus var. scolymus TaxID=59895 RepID=A0A124SEH5_CYNCS|nr:Peptidase S28 [Cynara cardunculus var. scolymus]
MAQLHHFPFLKSFLLVLTTLTCVSGKHFRTTKLGVRNRFTPKTADIQGTHNSEEYEVYNYTQTLDHFNFKTESYTTFQQRYVVNRRYWGGPTNNSPIFLYTGEETDIMGDVKYIGFVRVLASRFNALLVYIEHRYYGTSMPFGSKEEAYKNGNTLGFFSSEQALADYAQIIVDVKKDMSAQNCPVIAVGASYGGMLASWFRLKYPHIAYGALASSSPILYFLGLTPENGYDAIVSKDFKVSRNQKISSESFVTPLTVINATKPTFYAQSTSTSCYNTIRESWFEIDRVALQPHGLSKLSRMPLNTSQDLKGNLESRYDAMAQYDNPADNYLQSFCNAIDGAGEKTYIFDKILAGFAPIYGTSCYQVYDLKFNKHSGWDWQSCTEMVMPMGRGENDTMFQADPFDLDKYSKECEQVFGVTPRPYWAPIEFGGYDIIAWMLALQWLRTLIGWLHNEKPRSRL